MTKSTRKPPDVERRAEVFQQRIKTRIWADTPSPGNPYVAEKTCIHGYNILDISRNLSFTQSIYLNLKGDLPTPQQLELFDASLSALSNLGPRHAAVRAVMNAAVSKTRTHNLLPIGMSILSGEFLGAGEVESSVRFIRKNINQPAAQVATELLSSLDTGTGENPVIAPGFGARFGAIDPVCEQLAEQLVDLEASSKGLAWAQEFCRALKPHDMGWLITGLAAASFTDLGFSPKASAGLFQLASAPGMLAHGLEMSTRAITDMPFVDDANYIYREDS